MNDFAAEMQELLERSSATNAAVYNAKYAFGQSQQQVMTDLLASAKEVLNPKATQPRAGRGSGIRNRFEAEEEESVDLAAARHRSDRAARHAASDDDVLPDRWLD